MNGYELIAKMRRTRRKNPLTCSEQALYNELVAICNDEEWPDVFSCSNYELCNLLQISENTLKDARNRLIQIGLVYYQSGKSKRQFSKYSFIKELTTTSKFDTDAATDAATDGCTNAATNAADYYKLKDKPKEFIYKGEPEKFSLLTKIEISNSIEYLDRIAQKKFSQDQLISFFEAFKIQYSAEYYPNRGKVINHFRDWLKKQQNGHANNSISSKSGRDKQADASAALVAKLRQVTGAG